MITIAKHFRGIAYLLVIVILLQSCVIYSKHPSTIEDAEEKGNTRIKITIKNGQKYKLRWIEVEDGYVFSMKNTKRVYVNKSELTTNPHVNYRFIEAKDQGDYIRGITMTGQDTARVLIPIDQIEDIKLIDKHKTRFIRAVLITFSVITISIGLYINSNPPIF